MLKKGFTLIELMVVVSIMTLLSVSVLANYREGQKKYALAQAAQKLTSDLRKAQNMAISGTGIYGQYCGYGITIDASSAPYSYNLYADFSADCSLSDNRYSAGDTIVSTMTLPQGIKIDSTTPSPVDIFFKPPEPTTFINGSSLGMSGTVTLRAEGTVLPAKMIIFNTFGLIQTE